jgi:hypothetical protein
MFEHITRSLTAKLPIPLVLLALSACGRDNPARLRDTTGAKFALVCEGDVCHLHPEAGTPPPATCDGAKVWYSYFVGQFVSICSVSGFADSEGWGTDASLCRLAACESDDECPQQLLGEGYTCRAGLCQNADGAEELWNSPVTSLCFDEAPRPNDCHAQSDDAEVQAVFALARESCPMFGGACSVPTSCRQP